MNQKKLIYNSVFLVTLTTSAFIMLLFAAYFGVRVDRELNSFADIKITAQDIFNKESSFSTKTIKGPTGNPISTGPTDPPPSIKR